MNNMIDKIKKEYNEIIVWLKANPKTFFKYSLIILIASFCISLLQFFLFPSKEIYTIQVPTLYSKSSNIKQNEIIKEEKMGKIVRELQKYKEKKDNGELNQSDSIRIDYLFNEYQKIKNGN